MTTYINYKYIYGLLCLVLVVNGDSPEVKTTHGLLAGKVLKTVYNDFEYYGFMGIPYAAPSSDALRFMPPQPLQPWEGVLSAKKEKKACAQFNANVKKFHPLGHYGYEDCLYLDIFTPGIDNSKRNVIMFIFNEQFQSSYNKSKDYQPDFFMEEDVIIVTISHRLTAFGFLSLEDETLWGNSGLKDVVQGLEWIRDNIERFGGDPEKITLMGFGGGASMIDLLIHSKKNYLFKSAIFHSGNAWTSGLLQENVRERAFALAELFEKHPTTSKGCIETLNEIPAKNITQRDHHASPKDYFKETQRGVVTFGPIVEKDPEGLILDYPENSKEISTPIMMGFTSREGLELSLQYLLEPRYMSFLKKDFPLLLPIRANFRFDPAKEEYDDAVEDIKKIYFKQGIKIKRVTDFITFIGDVFSGYPTDYVARKYAKISKEPVYYYHFDYYGELNENKNNIMGMSKVEEGTFGSARGDELCYLFKCTELEEVYKSHKNKDAEEKEILIKMVRLWTNFAKYGNPTPDGDTILEDLKWPAYDLVEKRYLDIKKPMEIKQDLNKERFKFWDKFYEKWGARAVDGVIGTSPEEVIKDDKPKEDKSKDDESKENKSEEDKSKDDKPQIDKIKIHKPQLAKPGDDGSKDEL